MAPEPSSHQDNSNTRGSHGGEQKRILVQNVDDKVRGAQLALLLSSIFGAAHAVYRSSSTLSQQLISLEEMFINNDQVEALTRCLPNLDLSYLTPAPKSFIHRVPFDVFIDHIVILLCVEDVLSLRRVNKAFFLLTHEPLIWKRFLAEIPFPMPPVRPTFQYLSHETDYEIEQLVLRSISLENNWRRRSPQATSSIIFDTFYRVLDMKLLPGGKYLVASVRDDSRFFIHIYLLDHPKGPRVLARLPTQTKAYNLEAKYMISEGQAVIMIAYVRRSWLRGGPPNIDISEYSTQHPIDASYPILNELICVETELDILEALSNPNYDAGDPELARIALKRGSPFSQVISAVCQRPVEIVSLYEMNGRPYVLMVQSPNRVVCVDLMAQRLDWIVCTNHQEYANQLHTIRAARPLPYQNEVLVFRTIQVNSGNHGPDGPPNFLHLLEIYDHPSNGGRFADPKDIYVMGYNDITKVHISDYGVPTTKEDSYHLQLDYQPSPPISIYTELQNPSGVVHEVVWPSCTENEKGEKRYFYTLDHVCFQTRHDSEPRVTHVLPGAYRAFTYTSVNDDRKDAPSLVSLRRYINPEYQSKDYPVPRVDRSCSAMRTKLNTMPPNAYATIDGSSSAIEYYRQNGVGAITWDEGIGRVCIADGKTTQVEMVDFASVTRLDRLFRPWQMPAVQEGVITQ